MAAIDIFTPFLTASGRSVAGSVTGEGRDGSKSKSAMDCGECAGPGEMAGSELRGGVTVWDGCGVTVVARGWEEGGKFLRFRRRCGARWRRIVGSSGEVCDSEGDSAVGGGGRGGVRLNECEKRLWGVGGKVGFARCAGNGRRTIGRWELTYIGERDHKNLGYRQR
jgi:hypothetical protein